MTIFFTLFNILKKFNHVEPKVYYTIIEPLLDFLNKNNDKIVIAN